MDRKFNQDLAKRAVRMLIASFSAATCPPSCSTLMAPCPLKRFCGAPGELLANMKTCGHAHILGWECDVLFVSEAHDTIRKKVDTMAQDVPVQIC